MKYIVLALALVACAPSRPIDIGFHGSDEGYAKAVEAATYWKASCGVDLIHVHRGDGDVDLEEQPGLCPEGTWGLETSRREILDIIGPETPREICVMTGDGELPTLVHEYGHALGLGHEATGIMQPGLGYRPLAASGHMAPGWIPPSDCDRVMNP